MRAVFIRSDTSPMAEWWRTVDKGLLVAALLLASVGLLLGLAAGPAAAGRIGFADPYHFVYRHLAFAAASVAILFGVSMLDAALARRFSALLFIVCFLLMAVLLVVGHEAKGAQRWIRIGGLTFQPSEFIKPSLIVIVAWLLAQRPKFPNFPWAALAFAFYAATVGLLLLQPDVGQSALLSVAFVTVFFVSGMSWTWAGLLAGGGAGLTVALYQLLPHVRRRIDSFLNPTDYDTYQVDKAREALSRGGVFGVGPGEGAVKYQLPDAHTDFVFSVAGEEYGLLMCAFIVIVFAVIAIKGVATASRIEDGYTRAAATGLFTVFGLQAAINIAVNESLIPPKGMTLPFISSGGSSLLGSALTLGLALALIRRHPEVSLRSILRP